MVLPHNALGSYIRGSTPIASEVGCERSDPGTGRFRAVAPASNTRVLRGESATATLPVTTEGCNSLSFDR